MKEIYSNQWDSSSFGDGKGRDVLATDGIEAEIAWQLNFSLKAVVKGVVVALKGGYFCVVLLNHALKVLVHGLAGLLYDLGIFLAHLVDERKVESC